HRENSASPTSWLLPGPRFKSIIEVMFDESAPCVPDTPLSRSKRVILVGANVLARRQTCVVRNSASPTSWLLPGPRFKSIIEVMFDERAPCVPDTPLSRCKRVTFVGANWLARRQTCIVRIPLRQQVGSYRVRVSNPLLK
ncbi:hypothetical protein QCD79_30710, partial [Pseudomonas quasicaspiana]|nr:hypothetical protein [Pseudomonas quasicaspiana]